MRVTRFTVRVEGLLRDVMTIFGDKEKIMIMNNSEIKLLHLKILGRVTSTDQVSRLMTTSNVLRPLNTMSTIRIGGM